MRRVYQMASLAFLAFSIYLVVKSRQMEYFAALGPGAGFFPLWLGGLLAVLSIIWLVQVSIGPREPMDVGFIPSRQGAVRVLSVLVALALFAWVVESLGFQLTMLVFLATLLMTLLGGHVNAEGGTGGEFSTGIKSGDIRVLAVFDKTPSPFLPGVPTALSQGFTITAATARAFSAPKGTPKEIVNILAASIKKAMSDPEHKKKMDVTGLDLRFMDADQLSAYWDQVDATLQPIIEESKKK
jgi:putative tricarboxylic transport membrane protein